jgi:hypothetical protein
MNATNTTVVQETEMRDFILAEIKRIAAENGGQAPGRDAFEHTTGISRRKWFGVYWPRWSYALQEAGFKENTFTKKIDSIELLKRLAILTREVGKLPTEGEYRILRREDKTVPSHTTLRNHFEQRESLVDALINFAEKHPEYSDILALLPEKVYMADSVSPQLPKSARNDGYVYLIKSGNHYKIGKSGDVERRIKQIRISLPEKANLLHNIKTDDPSGIEAYWHKRFADKRANGEWFALTKDDVAAFMRRKLM